MNAFEPLIAAKNVTNAYTEFIKISTTYMKIRWSPDIRYGQALITGMKHSGLRRITSMYQK
jgi:hypothetical protein